MAATTYDRSQLVHATDRSLCTKLHNASFCCQPSRNTLTIKDKTSTTLFFSKSKRFYTSPATATVNHTEKQKMTLNNTIINNRVLAHKDIEANGPAKDYFRTETVEQEIPELKENEIFLRNIVFSLDPYIRYKFDGKDEALVVGFGIAEVIRSNHPRFAVGNLTMGPTGWEQYTHQIDAKWLQETAVLPASVLEQYPKIPLEAFNGILGLFGLTAWSSLKRIGNLKEGETLYVNSAAGTLGQLVGQLAKRAGVRVIGSAGTDEKVDFLTSQLGFDSAFNYKKEDKREALTKAAPEGVDVFYDLVADDTLEIILDLMNGHGRVLMVGILALHNGAAPHYVKNLVHILMSRIRVEGYLVDEYYSDFPAFWQEVAPLIESGKVVYSDTTLKTTQIGDLVDSYLDLLHGKYTGKLNVRIADL